MYGHRKFIVILVSIGVLTLITLMKNAETARWFGGELALLVGAYIGIQGYVDKNNGGNNK